MEDGISKQKLIYPCIPGVPEHMKIFWKPYLLLSSLWYPWKYELCRGDRH